MDKEKIIIRATFVFIWLCVAGLLGLCVHRAVVGSLEYLVLIPLILAAAGMSIYVYMVVLEDW